MNTIEERMQTLSDELGKVEGFIDEVNRLKIGKTYVDDICVSIQSFISQETTKLQDQPDSEKAASAFAMISALHEYSKNYMLKHTNQMYVLQGRVIEKQENSKKIKDILEEYKNQKIAEERIEEKIEHGEDPENRDTGDRPEKMSDVRRVKQNQPLDSDT